MKFCVRIALLFLFVNGYSQETFQVNGTTNKNHNYYAFVNATIYIDHETVINNATLLIQDGIIKEVGTAVKIPNGTVVQNLKGKTIYPSFIDLYSNYGMPEVKAPKPGMYPQMESNVKGAYGWNQAIRTDVDACKHFTADNKSAEELRGLGFGAVLTSQRDGIARGTAVFVTLASEQENSTVLKDKAAALYSFNKGTSTQDYPSSQMGSIALLRQTYLDAQWYAANANKKEFNISLEAWNSQQGLPQIFEADDKLTALRADKIGDEFKVQYIIKGAGDEYQRIDNIKTTNAKFILPLNFPLAFDVEDSYAALIINLDEMKHWELAPANPSYFEKNFIPFSLTTADLKEKKDFYKNLRKAIKFGLSEKQALKALTSTPAEMMGMKDKVGTIKKGAIANFIICSGNIFDEKNTIYENWVQGLPYILANKDQFDIRGNYDLKIGNEAKYKLNISGELEKPKATVTGGDTGKTTVNLTFANTLISLNFKEGDGMIRLSGSISESPSMNFSGKGQLANGDWVSWSATYQSAFKPEEKKDTAQKNSTELGEIIYPFTAYGRPIEDKNVVEKFKTRWDAVIIKNVTVWTNEADGILKNKDVYITEGKIVRIADNIEPTKGAFAKVIDGTGKHLTSGIIDEHSHIAISRGVNEGTQSSSSEVRIGDVVNCDDVNIYRQLAGGVTTAQLLHGSANAIGGQSAIIKLRWGKTPEEMKFQNADGFIKFALGENVKQSNWGDQNVVRFPQTRMGVEQVYYDYFTRAKEYEKAINNYNSAEGKIKLLTGPPRRDIEMDALVEILNKKRFITCHSYVQSEINMLMHVGDSMGFRVNTFTHILEGYKVADKMKAHGVGGSTFSDWWAYKMEVKEAIPYNATILNNMGVVTAINSDDAEMGRRLNQEAAKTVKYGGLTEEEAWKLVTLNPAKLLHIDNKVGSIKVGKDADMVLWSDNPLSIYAKPEKTLVDGIIYYDIENDLQLREEIKTERARLIQKMIAEKDGGEKTQQAKGKKKKLYHCETLGDGEFE